MMNLESERTNFLQQTPAIPGCSITWEPEQVSNDADLEFMVERNRVTFAEVTGAIREQFGKAVTMWRKDSTGGWKCVVDTWKENPSVSFRWKKAHLSFQPG